MEFGLGIFAGAMLSCIIFLISSGGVINVVRQYDKAKAACEETLPRNQQCVMRFEPE
jgi:hypothetical protein